MKKFLKGWLVALAVGIFLSVGTFRSVSALTFSDDFQGYSSDPTGQSGGSGDWNSSWTQGSQNDGGTFLSGASKIDGTRAYAFFGNSGSAGTSRNRGFAATSSQFTITLSFRADYNVTADDGNGSLSRRLAFTIRDGNSTDHFDGQRLSFFFAEGNNSFQWYDGADHTLSGVTFSSGSIYDLTVTVDPSTRAYSFSVAQRGGSSGSSSGNWTLGSNGEALDSIALLMRGPSGSGNDAFFDSITAVPEPSNAALCVFGGLVGLIAISRRLNSFAKNPAS